MDYINLIVDLITLALIVKFLRHPSITVIPPNPLIEQATNPPVVVSVNGDEYEILVKDGEQDWRLVGRRPHGHPDIHEALRTRDLAIRRPDGVLDVGEQ